MPEWPEYEITFSMKCHVITGKANEEIFLIQILNLLIAHLPPVLLSTYERRHILNYKRLCPLVPLFGYKCEICLSVTNVKSVCL